MSAPELIPSDVDPAYAAKVLQASPEIKKVNQKVSTDLKTWMFYAFFAVSLFLICCFGLIAES